jgi:hypothetical protein
VVERERGPTRESPQPVSIDMGPHTYNGGGPDAVADMEEELHRLGVYETDPTRDRSAAPERKNRIVVQIHGAVVRSHARPSTTRADQHGAVRRKRYQPRCR